MYFGGSPLNRLSWLRPSHTFLNSIVQNPKTRWVLFNKNNLLTTPSEDPESLLSLAYLTTQDLQPFLGPKPYFGQAQEIGHTIPESDPVPHGTHSPTESIRHRGPRIVFLGVHGLGEESANFTDPLKNTDAVPYFAMDISSAELVDEDLQRFLDNSTLGRNVDGNENLTWTSTVPVIFFLDSFSAAVFASARSLIDWNRRNKFCPACGSPSYSMWGGWKIACSSLLPWVEPVDPPCFSAKGLHNFMYPRTDMVVMMIVIDEKNDKILLGRRKKFEQYYSCITGFVEPGESLEDAVAREALEETGVHVWDARYHSGQPWPDPSNLLLGFYARGDSTKPVRIDLDNELSDARWFTRQEIKTVLDHPEGTRYRRSDFQKKKGNADTSIAAAEDGASEDKPPFKIPGLVLIAGVLVRDWIEGKIGFQHTPLRNIHQFARRSIDFMVHCFLPGVFLFLRFSIFVKPIVTGSDNHESSCRVAAGPHKKKQFKYRISRRDQLAK